MVMDAKKEFEEIRNKLTKDDGRLYGNMSSEEYRAKYIVGVDPYNSNRPSESRISFYRVHNNGITEDLKYKRLSKGELNQQVKSFMKYYKPLNTKVSFTDRIKNLIKRVWK